MVLYIKIMMMVLYNAIQENRSMSEILYTLSETMDNEIHQWDTFVMKIHTQHSKYLEAESIVRMAGVNATAAQKIHKNVQADIEQKMVVHFKTHHSYILFEQYFAFRKKDLMYAEEDHSILPNSQEDEDLYGDGDSSTHSSDSASESD